MTSPFSSGTISSGLPGTLRAWLWACAALLLACVRLPAQPGGSSSLADAEARPALSQMELLDDERNLAVGDRLVYEVLEEREDPVLLFVDDRGQVRVPLIGNVDALGKTPRALAYEIKAKAEVDYFYQATVMLRHQAAQNSRGRVTIVGHVRSQGPQMIPADEVLTVSAALLRAGGVVPGGDASKITVTRKDSSAPGGERQIVLDIGHMFETGDFAEDMPVQPDDLILVPKSDSTGGQVYVLGAVNAPGLYEVPATGDFTLSKAILRAGGFTRFADKRRVKLIRQDESLPEDQRTLEINVADILDRGQREFDVIVKPDDIIRVGERTIVF